MTSLYIGSSKIFLYFRYVAARATERRLGGKLRLNLVLFDPVKINSDGRNVYIGQFLVHSLRIKDHSWCGPLNEE